MPRRCGDCEYGALPFQGTVECRRAPPAAYFEPTGRVSNIRPRVGQEYWCGEFKAAPGVESRDVSVDQTQNT